MLLAGLQFTLRHWWPGVLAGICALVVAFWLSAWIFPWGLAAIGLGVGVLHLRTTRQQMLGGLSKVEPEATGGKG